MASRFSLKARFKKLRQMYADWERLAQSIPRVVFNAMDRLDDGEDASAWFGHWRRWIHQHGPVLIVLGVDAQFLDGAPLFETIDVDSVSSNHAAALVGYGPNGFLIRCSWGESWGAEGYAVATEAYLEQATRESYGVVV